MRSLAALVQAVAVQGGGFRLRLRSSRVKARLEAQVGRPLFSVDGRVLDASGCLMCDQCMGFVSPWTDGDD